MLRLYEVGLQPGRLLVAVGAVGDIGDLRLGQLEVVLHPHVNRPIVTARLEYDVVVTPQAAESLSSYSRELIVTPP